jgi:hypothetical protein
VPQKHASFVALAGRHRSTWWQGALGQFGSAFTVVLGTACSSPKGIVVPIDSGAGIEASAADVDFLDGSAIDDSGACVSPPSVCPSNVPSYSREVAPILDAKCNNCHTLGPGLPWPLTNYQDVRDWRTYIITDLANCTMPPPDGGTVLTSAQAHTLVTWLACGTPDN